MKAKCYLQQIKKIDSVIQYKEGDILLLRAKRLSIPAGIKDDPVKSSGNLNPLEQATINLLTREEELCEEIEEWKRIRKEAMDILDKLNHPLNDILYKRYFEYKRWEQIATDLNYSYRQIIRLHGNALLEFEKFLKG